MTDTTGGSASGRAPRIGWLGGSFDPVHEGHLAIARLAADRFDLGRVLLVPAASPPHKPQGLQESGVDRCALVEIAVADDPRLEVCDVELHRDGPSYSYDTARQLLEREGGDADLHFVIGADTLADLVHWYRIAELARMVTFCAVTRPGWELETAPLLDVLGAESVERIAAHLLEAEPHPASSTEIRATLARGERPEHLPAGVYEEIEARGLYGAGGASSRDTSGLLGS